MTRRDYTRFRRLLSKAEIPYSKEKYAAVKGQDPRSAFVDYMLAGREPSRPSVTRGEFKILRDAGIPEREISRIRELGARAVIRIASKAEADLPGVKWNKDLSRVRVGNKWMDAVNYRRAQHVRAYWTEVKLLSQVWGTSVKSARVLWRVKEDLVKKERRLRLEAGRLAKKASAELRAGKDAAAARTNKKALAKFQEWGSAQALLDQYKLKKPGSPKVKRGPSK